jgi:hypothetical protein
MASKVGCKAKKGNKKEKGKKEAKTDYILRYDRKDRGTKRKV